MDQNSLLLPHFHNFVFVFHRQNKLVFFAADREIKPASSRHGGTLLLNYYAIGTMNDFGGINLFLVQGGIFREQNSSFFTKNVKGKGVFLNIGSGMERCIHDD